MKRLPRCLLLVPLVACIGSPLAGQGTAGDVQLTSGVEPTSVTVGDRFRVGIRVTAPEGVEVRFPGFADPTGSLELVDTARLVRDPDDPRTVVQVYPLAAWRTTVSAPVLPVELHLPDGTVRLVRMAMPLPEVRSVLPADTAGLQPRDHRGIIEARPARALWPWLLVGLLFLLLFAWLMRKLRNRVSAAETTNPRDWALAELDRARKELISSPDRRAFFSVVSSALRGYLAGSSARWGTDLTTRELIDALEAAGLEPARVAELREILDTADGVKFARMRVSRQRAEEVWEGAREWIRSDAALVSPPVLDAPREAA
jgi:hypothetical protein